MADFRKLKPIIRKAEGGFVNDPIDNGGATMYGITLKTFRETYGNDKSINDLKNITEEQWDNIFKNRIWNKWQADKINNQSIANLLVDWLWGSGINGIKLPQQILELKADGIVGKLTLMKINDYPNQKELFDKLWNRRLKHFQNIAENSVIALEKKLGRKLTELNEISEPFLSHCAILVAFSPYHEQFHQSVTVSPLRLSSTATVNERKSLPLPVFLISESFPKRPTEKTFVILLYF